MLRNFGKSSLLLFFASSVLTLTVPQSTEAHIKCPVKESLFGTTNDICPHIHEPGAVRFEDGRFPLPFDRNTNTSAGINIQNGSSKLYSAPFDGRRLEQSQSIGTMSSGVTSEVGVGMVRLLLISLSQRVKANFIVRLLMEEALGNLNL